MSFFHILKDNFKIYWAWVFLSKYPERVAQTDPLVGQNRPFIIPSTYTHAYFSFLLPHAGHGPHKGPSSTPAWGTCWYPSYCSAAESVWAAVCGDIIYSDRGQRLYVEFVVILWLAGICGKINTKFLPMFTPSVFPGVVSLINVTHWIQRTEIKLRASLVFLGCSVKENSLSYFSSITGSWILITPLLLWIMRVLFADYYGEEENTYVKTHTLMKKTPICVFRV